MLNPPTSYCLVAIVDDEPPVRKGLSNLLKSAGYATLCFESGEALLAFGRFADIDVLMLDIRLDGGIDGFEVQRRLIGAGADMPVIFMSAYVDHLTQQRALRAGALAFLPKPIDVDVLLSEIQVARRLPRSAP